MGLEHRILVDAATIFNRHRTAVESILKQYREDVFLCESRFAREYAAERRAEVRKDAAGKIAQADRELQSAISERVKEAREDIYGEVAAVPIPRVREALDFYRTYGIKLSEIEVRALAENVRGNYAAMRALQSLAAGSGFKVDCPSISEVDNDLKRIEHAARVPNMYAPEGYYSEAADVMGNVPRFRADGSVWGYGNKPDAIYFSIVGKARTDLENALMQEMQQRWQNFQITSIEPMNAQSEGEAGEAGAADTNSETEPINTVEAVAPNVSVDVDFNAAAIAAENAASKARSADIIARYKR